MPEGSSSAAPVMRPGPSSAKNRWSRHAGPTDPTLGGPWEVGFEGLLRVIERQFSRARGGEEGVYDVDHRIGPPVQRVIASIRK
jgi:hypothetical protein